jgi:hypothetical protein
VVARVAWRAEDVHLGLCLTGLELKHSRAPDRKEEMYVPGWFPLRCSRPLALPGTDFGTSRDVPKKRLLSPWVEHIACLVPQP